MGGGESCDEPASYLTGRGGGEVVEAEMLLRVNVSASAGSRISTFP